MVGQAGEQAALLSAAAEVKDGQSRGFQPRVGRR